MRLKFIACKPITSYAPFNDGDIREVSDEQGQYLLATFKDNFSRVDSPKVEIKVETKAVDAPTHNKVAQPPKYNRGR